MGEGSSTKSNYHFGFIFLIVFNAGLGAFFFGYSMGALNPLEKLLEYDIFPGMSSLAIGMFGSFVSAGGIPGSFSGGKLANSVGRRNAFIITDAIGVVGVLLTLIQNLYIVLIGRVICGVAVGLNSALVPLYINEVSPVSLSGITGSMNQVLICLGIVVAYLMGYGVPYSPKVEVPYSDIYWRIVLVIPAGAAILRSLLLVTVFRFDTPKYLVSQSKEDEAREVLKKIYTDESASEQLILLKNDQEKQNMEGKITMSEMLGPKFRKRLLVGIGLSIFQQVSGINAIINYSTTLFIGTTTGDGEQTFESAQSSYEESRQLTVILGIVNLVSPLMGGLFTTKVGRKTLLIVGTAICGAALFLLTFVGPLLSKVMIFVYIVAFECSLGPIVWLYIPEILPDVGVGAAVLFNWIFATIVVLTYPQIPSIDTAFMIYGCCMAAGIVFMVFFVKETKDKTAAEINEMYSLSGEETNAISLLRKNDKV
jgi:sugar porter (SP) family MFS transporter